MRKKLHQNFAVLKPSSPFFPLFRDGRAPIKNVWRSTPVKLEGSDETEAYLLDWSACTVVERIAISEAISKAFRETQPITPEAFRSFMDRGGELPIRISSTSSASLGASTRSFL